MYPVSEKFLRTISQNARRFYWTGTITTKAGQTYIFENKDIVKGSGYITRSCCGSNEIELGSVYAAELGISLFLDVDRYSLEDAEITLSFHLVFPDGTEEEVPMGIFEITEANRSVKFLQIKAYDYMLRFDKDVNIEATSGTVYNYVHTICEECGVEMGQTKEELDALPNGTAIFAVYQENDISTFRDVLYYVAQAVGCVAQINRLGQLVLLPYQCNQLYEIPWTQRFESNYSDFVTRYTAVSSTNLIAQEAEYYALDPDDGLTLNLGTNPLMQFGLKATRERLLRNVLNAISAVEYVPFDSKTIGNPALDPMDCVRFTGGHADASKMSCITSITYNINGKHSLKCVGKNPKLAEAKSRNDKNISGIIGQIETNKTVVYDFVNVSPCTVGDTPTEIMSIDYVAKESTSAMFLSEILINIVAEDEEKSIAGTATYENEEHTQVQKAVTFDFTAKKHPELTVTYKMNGTAIGTFIPEQICREGHQIVTLFFPLSSIEPNSTNNFSVLLQLDGGTGYIAEEHIRATISGQGLVSGLSDWNGRISVTDEFPVFSIDNFAPVTILPFQQNVSSVLPAISESDIHTVFGTIIASFGQYSVIGMNERITVGAVIKTATISTEFESQYGYNRNFVQTTDNQFSLRTAYTYSGLPATVDRGLLTTVELPYPVFDEVTEVEVEK